MEDPKKASSIYEFTAKDIDGNEVISAGQVNRSPNETLRDLVGHRSGAVVDSISVLPALCTPVKL